MSRDRQQVTVEDALDILQLMFQHTDRAIIRRYLIEYCWGNMESAVDGLLTIQVPEPPALEHDFVQPPSYYLLPDDCKNNDCDEIDISSKLGFLCNHLSNRKIEIICNHWFKQQNDDNLADDMAKLIIKFATCKKINFRVMTLAGTQIEINICRFGQIIDIMNAIYSEYQVPLERQQIIYNESKITDNPFQNFADFYVSCCKQAFFVLK